MLTEVVRLPVGAAGIEPVLTFMRGHEFFRQEALRSHRFLRNEDEPEVMVIMDWESRQAMSATSDNDLSKTFRAELAPLLAGAPVLSFYAPVG